MRKGIMLFLMMVALSAQAQLTLEQCYELARQNYPAIKQYALVEQSRDFTLQNAAKGWLPQVSVNGRASYQSKVTQLPIDVSQFGIDYKGLSKDQYDAHVMVNQPIYDGGVITANKNILKAQTDVQTAQLDVTMYSIRERVNQMFFSVLLIDEQLAQNQLLQDDLKLGLNTVSAMMKGGIANQTDVDNVKVEQIKARQQEHSLRTARHTYLTMLGSFINLSLDANTQLEKPADPGFKSQGSDPNNRPELAMYDSQNRLLDARLKALDASLMPKVGAFLQGGVGNPGLNMLKNGWDTYYRIGATISWNIGSFYTRKNDQQLIAIERQQITANRETFLFNNRLQQQQTNGQIENLRQQVNEDEEIIQLREGIRNKSEKRVQNGIETVNEMLRDINAVGEARQQKAIHEVQLLQEIYELKTINNN
jgi:outer membrane protein TolC